MRSLHQRGLYLPCKQMHRNFIRANSISNGQLVLEVERHLNSIIASLRQKHHVQEGSRFPSPQLAILLHEHMKILLMGSTNAPYVQMR